MPGFRKYDVSRDDASLNTREVKISKTSKNYLRLPHLRYKMIDRFVRSLQGDVITNLMIMIAWDSRIMNFTLTDKA